MKSNRRYDVVVAGGGIAGVSAALAAARRGAKAALIEKTVYPGGLATAGVVFMYLPLCDGNGTQVTYGLAEELLQRSLKYGPGDIPAYWSGDKNADKDERYAVDFSPASFMLALDEVMQESGIDIWYDTVVTDTTVKSGTLEAIEVCNKSGKGTIEAKCFVDATGDADLAYYSGHKCIEGKNPMSIWGIEHLEEDVPGRRELGKNTVVFAYGGGHDVKTDDAGINGKLVTDFVLKGRNTYREKLNDDYGSEKHTRNSRFPVMLPAMAQYRTTRRIDGVTTLSDNQEWTRFDDSIGLAGDWRKAGYVWEIPYRSLIPKDLKGMLAAGRCIASDGDAWDVTRVIPVAALTGEGAGVAAAMSAEQDCTPEALDYKAVQAQLQHERKYPLHFEDVGLNR